jgi:hypothetical protein
MSCGTPQVSAGPAALRSRRLTLGRSAPTTAVQSPEPHPRHHRGCHNGRYRAQNREEVGPITDWTEIVTTSAAATGRPLPDGPESLRALSRPAPRPPHWRPRQRISRLDPHRPRTAGGVAGVALQARSPVHPPTSLKTGRTDRRSRAALAPTAGQLTSDALQHLRHGHAVPVDPEHACHLYLRHSGQLAAVLCLSCSAPLEGRQRKWCAECRASARRRDRAVRNGESD